MLFVFCGGARAATGVAGGGTVPASGARHGVSGKLTCYHRKLEPKNAALARKGGSLLFVVHSHIHPSPHSPITIDPPVPCNRLQRGCSIRRARRIFTPSPVRHRVCACRLHCAVPPWRPKLYMQLKNGHRVLRGCTIVRACHTPTPRPVRHILAPPSSMPPSSRPRGAA